MRDHRRTHTTPPWSGISAAQPGATGQEIDLLLLPLLPEVLFDRKVEVKVSNLLSKMRSERSITNAGTRSQPRWELSWNRWWQGAEYERKRPLGKAKSLVRMFFAFIGGGAGRTRCAELQSEVQQYQSDAVEAVVDVFAG